MSVLPTDYVKVGDSYELSHFPGSLYVVANVKRDWSAHYRTEQWQVELLCVVGEPHGFRPGQRLNVYPTSGHMRACGYRRVG